MVKKEISYEVTKKEQRNRRKRMMFVSLFFFLVLYVPLYAIYLIFIVSGDLKKFVLTEIMGKVFILCFLVSVVFYLFLCIFPYKYRLYKLDEKGIFVQKGNKSRYFKWHEFSFFFKNFDDKPKTYFFSSRKDLYSQKIENIRGEKLFLVLSDNSILRKKALVVYSEPDNSDTVKDFISGKLPQKTINANIFLKIIFK